MRLINQFWVHCLNNKFGFVFDISLRKIYYIQYRLFIFLYIYHPSDSNYDCSYLFWKWKSFILKNVFFILLHSILFISNSFSWIVSRLLHWIEPILITYFENENSWVLRMYFLAIKYYDSFSYILLWELREKFSKQFILLKMKIIVLRMFFIRYI